MSQGDRLVNKMNPSAPADIRRAIEPDQSLFKYSLFTLVGSLIGVAVTSLLLYMLVINGSNRQLTESVFQGHAQAYADFFDHTLDTLQGQLAHIGARGEVPLALQNLEYARLTQLEQSIGVNLPDLISIQLLPFGAASLRASEAKLSFAEVDMINRAERGQSVPAEALELDEQRVLVLVEVVRSPATDAIVGVIFVKYSIELLKNHLDSFDTSDGPMQLQQLFPKSPAQTLLQHGPAMDSFRSTAEYRLRNPNLRVKFQPSDKLAAEIALPGLLFWSPIAVAPIIIFLSVLIGYFRLRNSIRADAVELVNYCRKLIAGGDEREPSFHINLFHSMAATLAYTDREKLLDETVAAKSHIRAKHDEAEEILPEMEVEDFLESELEEELILDLDLAGLNKETSQPEVEDNDLVVDDLETGRDILEHPPGREIPQSIFRAYDIRGIMDETLDTDIAFRIGQAVGTEAKLKGDDTVVVGADGRLSSPELGAALIQGLRESGCDVVNIGMVPTPLVYYATCVLSTKSGVMITGSHNPANYNGFKIVLGGNTLAEDEIQALYRRIVKGDYSKGHGDLDNVDIVANYIETITNDVALAKPIKVVVDCGNGVAGVVAPALLEALGCEVVPLYCEIDGNFPNHHPDPGKPENLQDLIGAVAEHDADLGLAFDGDGDRMGVVTNKGTIIYPDRLLMLFAKDVASRNPGEDIIYDVKCSRRLAGLISNYGGRPIMWKTGHSLIKAKMRETGALLAGEMSGHIFFKERWFGFDDGVYSAARLLEILGTEALDAESVFESFPDDISTPEINIEVGDESKFTLVEQLLEAAKFDDGEICTIDGLRVDFESGWGLVRASNTTPALVLRFGAEDESALAQIQDRFKTALLAVEPNLPIPF